MKDFQNRSRRITVKRVKRPTFFFRDEDGGLTTGADWIFLEMAMDVSRF
jgi:hypothetical protein